MPITDKEFDSDAPLTPLAGGIHTWLCQRCSKAYSLAELNNKSLEIGRTFKTKRGILITPKMMKEALDELIERTDVSRIVSKEMKDKNGSTTYYYRCKN